MRLDNLSFAGLPKRLYSTIHFTSSQWLVRFMLWSKSVFKPSGILGGHLSQASIMKLLLWMGCQSIAGLLLNIKFAHTHFYTQVERGNVRIIFIKSVLPKNTTQWPQLRLKCTSCSLDLVFFTITICPLHLQLSFHAL